MVEMAAAMAILLITAAVLLSLLLGTPWWVQAVGAVMAIVGLTVVSRWLVRETLGAPATKNAQVPLTIDFEYLDGEGKIRPYAVEVVRIRGDYFEGTTLDDRMHHVFFLTRIKSSISDRCSGKSLAPKAWAATHRADAFSAETIEA